MILRRTVNRKFSLSIRRVSNIACNYSHKFEMKCVVLVTLYLSVSLTLSKSTHDKLLVISYDGFRYDYLDKNLTPYMHSLKTSSSYAKSLLNVFPTQTFVNHFSIATGMYSGVHGVIGNNVFDHKKGQLLNYDYDLFHYNKDITPIWVSAA